MTTHIELRQAMDDLAAFASWSREARYLGDNAEFVEGMKAGRGMEYEAARKGLCKVLSVLREPKSIELLLRVTRMLPPYQEFTFNPDYPYPSRERMHYEDFSTSSRDALQYWDSLRDLALRLEAEAMAGESLAPAAPDNWLTVTKGADRLTDKLDGFWDKGRCKTEITRLCNKGKLEHIGKSYDRRVNPLAIDALALSVRDADLARGDEEFME